MRDYFDVWKHFRCLYKIYVSTWKLHFLWQPYSPQFLESCNYYTDVFPLVFLNRVMLRNNFIDRLYWKCFRHLQKFCFIACFFFLVIIAFSHHSNSFLIFLFSLMYLLSVARFLRFFFQFDWRRYLRLFFYVWYLFQTFAYNLSFLNVVFTIHVKIVSSLFASSELILSNHSN